MLQIGEILIFEKYLINENFKYIYVLSNYACYNHNISNSQCEINLNNILTTHFQLDVFFNLFL